jgi:hypothetical protein
LPAVLSPELLPLRAFHLHNAMVVDPICSPSPLPLPSTLVAGALSLAPTPLQQREAILPAVISLAQASEADRAQLLEACGERVAAGHDAGFAALLSAPCSHAQLALHFKARSLLGSDGGNRWLLRLHDPAVVHQLRWMLSPATWAWLAGSIEQWTYVLDGSWHSFEPVVANGVHPAKPNQRDLERMHRVGAINSVCARTRRQGDAYAWQRGPQIEALIERARAAHRLQREADQVGFALDGLLCGEHFDRHPALADRLAARADEDTYADAVGDLDASDWRDIAACAAASNQREPR